jgi:hypothetical protein
VYRYLNQTKKRNICSGGHKNQEAQPKPNTKREKTKYKLNRFGLSVSCNIQKTKLITVFGVGFRLTELTKKKLLRPMLPSLSIKEISKPVKIYTKLSTLSTKSARPRSNLSLSYKGNRCGDTKSQTLPVWKSPSPRIHLSLSEN